VENFKPSENDYNYNPFIENKSEYCLMKKIITKNGGKYKSKIVNYLPKVENNEKAVLIDDDFTKEICLDKKFGSGRQRGAFVCMDFLTRKLSKKYGLEYSNKTCFDNLDYDPDVDYSVKINKIS